MDAHTTNPYFSASYWEARDRFRKSAESLGATLLSYPIHADGTDDLTIDVATIAPSQSRAILLSSALHGAEGFFGSAVQLAILERIANSPHRPRVGYVLIHAVNPYGFARGRRFDQQNIDLNRNFHNAASDYTGAPAGYRSMNHFLNPQSPPSRMEPYKLKVLWNILRRGVPSFKESVAGGQYDYPEGIFFGGHGPSQSFECIRDHCESWLRPFREIIHIDFHSGLGKFGRYKLLLAEGLHSDAYPWYRDTFGLESVEPLSTANGTAYRVSGMFGDWMMKRFSDRTFRFVAAEFGTYSIVRVLGAIRAENRAHHYAHEDSDIYRMAKKELAECFCPSDLRWRDGVVSSGLKIVGQAEQALASDSLGTSP
ncbi:hypothetical protein Mal15_37290 [Stieleria maiorica]|uniref:DUF2817 domain-containing protein n=1 Tax=Stieleria maiorica TaxID=2795974 RepID=A0A5B9MFQ1_9BACT|nr:M14 family metallopeptidase [Stieleria maiorica]QEF99663.1 hypothetical protein Mal15_37290 [Stieleria maiorica]